MSLAFPLEQDARNQLMPGQRRDVTYVSRLQSMQAAIDAQLEVTWSTPIISVCTTTLVEANTCSPTFFHPFPGCLLKRTRARLFFFVPSLGARSPTYVFRKGMFNSFARVCLCF